MKTRRFLNISKTKASHKKVNYNKWIICFYKIKYDNIIKLPTKLIIYQYNHPFNKKINFKYTQG